jgi:hypothetical protein
MELSLTIRASRAVAFPARIHAGQEKIDFGGSQGLIRTWISW